MKILIIGNRGGTNVGGSFERAALQLGIKVELIEARHATSENLLLRNFYWRPLGRRPIWLNSFSKKVSKVCDCLRPDTLLAVGFAPINHHILGRIKSNGIKTINYSTDDPWNSVHRASWFMKAMTFYDRIYSTRKANIRDFVKAGCKKVAYLPFGWDSNILTDSLDTSVKSQFECDIMFAGSADLDRLPYIEALLKSGLKFKLYGSFWDKFQKTARRSAGQVEPAILGMAIQGAKISLCLVRRANRDGHCMRTFEVPAVGTCMLAEDTSEHREIFGDEGKAVVYFRTIEEMIQKTKFLLGNEAERHRLANAAHRLIIDGRHTYKDRLQTMLECAFP